MKYLLTIIFILNLSVAANAAIITEKDDFDGSVTVKSKFEDVAPWALIVFMKDKQQHAFLFSRVETDWWFFDRNIDMKINGGVIHTITSAKTSFQMLPVRRMYASHTIFDLPANLTDDFRKAQRIDIRIHYSNHPSDVWTVPDHVLKEWQRILNNEQ